MKLKVSSQEDAKKWLQLKSKLSFRWLNWRSLMFLSLAGGCLTHWVSSPAALSLGILFTLTLENPFPLATKIVAKYLLQICVVLLGFSLNLTIVLQAGSQGVFLGAGSIGATFLLGNQLRKWLKIPAQTSCLISAGTAICGGSAIAAISSVINAAESEISIAMGTVFVLNAIALYLLPAFGHALHLTPTQFGTWAGVAIHDVSSVVGAASQFGLSALETATAVKLSRSLWIIPISLSALRLSQQSQLSTSNSQRSAIQIPWFIGLFLLAAILRSWIPEIAVVVPTIKQISTTGFTLTLFLIGTGLSRQTLKSVGLKPMLEGVLLWVFISTSSLWLTLHLVH
ncbi:putative sulfate exporter family transporter [Cyanobacteria bacterium FACHB-63]|nr:putative sulfate exporter family transporter [Cyanobacteria bacterium FACHB-63]